MQEESNSRDRRGRLLVQPGMISITCAHCGTEFHDHPSQSRRYHSDECKAAARRRKETRHCKGCGVAFEIHPSRKNVYHSLDCYATAVRSAAATAVEARLSEATRRQLARTDDRRTVPTSGVLPPDIDVRSYLMGVFDGEGCITGGYDKRDGRYFLVVSVCMANEAVVRLFRDTWGGTCGPRARLTTGGLTLWDWRRSSAQALDFLEFAAGHSVVKREQAIVALHLARNIAEHSTGLRLSDADRSLRQQLVTTIRSMNGARSRFSASYQQRLRLP